VGIVGKIAGPSVGVKFDAPNMISKMLGAMIYNDLNQRLTIMEKHWRDVVDIEVCDDETRHRTISWPVPRFWTPQLIIVKTLFITVSTASSCTENRQPALAP
jgi:hypothetical protein